jgi:hypothetical protein
MLQASHLYESIARARAEKSRVHVLERISTTGYKGQPRGGPEEGSNMGIHRRHILALTASAIALCGSLMLEGTPAWAGAPTATTEPAKLVKRANAVLDGVVNPEGSETSYYFEYGTEACSATCGTKTPTEGPIPGTASKTVELKILRLKPGAVYHYRLVASNAEGTVPGAEQTFTTLVAELKEYVFDKEILGPGVNPLEPKENLKFKNPVGLGINQKTGDVYVSDKGAEPVVIDQFNSSGEFQSSTKLPSGSEEDATFNLAVDNSGIPGQQGDVYLTDITHNVVYKFEPNAKSELALDKTTPKIGEGVLNEPRGIAVDSNGDVYVTIEPGSVIKFSPTGVQLNGKGEPSAEPLITGLSGLRGLAVDDSGNIYVSGESGTVEYTSLGVCINSCVPINQNEGEAVALDTVGDIFVSNETSVSEYGPTPGHPLIQNPVLEKPGTFAELTRGLAVSDTSNALYVAETNKVVKVFRFLDVKPVTVTTGPAIQVSGPVEALTGTVNAGGQEPAEFFFQYGTSPCLAETCGAVAIEQSEVPLYGDEEIPVSVRLDNLPPNTTFFYRIVGVNEESGLEYGAEQTFTTGSPVGAPPPPAPEGAAPESKTPASSPVYPLLTSIAPVPIPKVPIPKALTRAQHLAKALAACNRKPRKQRAACRVQARRKYGPVTKGVAKKRRG